MLQCAITEQVVLLNAYATAFGIIQEFRLPAVPIYVNAAKKYIQRKQISRVQDLLKNVKGTIQDRDWDAVVMAVIEVFVNDVRDVSTAEKFIKRLESADAKCEANVKCGNLRRAYTEAAQVHRNTGSTERLRWVRSLAIQAGDKTTRSYCEAYLTKEEPGRPFDDDHVADHA